MSGTVAHGLPGSPGGGLPNSPGGNARPGFPVPPPPNDPGPGMAGAAPSATPGSGPTAGAPAPGTTAPEPVRVNLLPPEFQQRLALSRARRRAALIVAVAVGLVIALTLFSFLQVGRADSELQDAQEAQAAAQVEVAKYAEVPRVATQLAELKAALTEALSSEVLFSSMMSSVAGVLPEGVNLTSLSFTLPTTGAKGKSSTVKKPGSTGTVEESTGVGDVAFSGTAPSLDAVSTFLDRLEGREEFEFVKLTSATLETTSSSTTAGKSTPTAPPAEGTYKFEGTAQLSKAALSGRYAQETKQQGAKQ